MTNALMTTCPPEFDLYTSDYAGHCPCCHKAVLYSAESDGPVWTCPADLSERNPHRESKPAWLTDEVHRRTGVYSNCGEHYGRGCNYEDIPLHGACYGAGNY